MDKLSWMNESDAREFANQYDLSGGQIDNTVRKITMNEVITGVRPEILEIHDMCKSEKIESENTARRMGFTI